MLNVKSKNTYICILRMCIHKFRLDVFYLKVVEHKYCESTTRGIRVYKIYGLHGVCIYTTILDSLYILQESIIFILLRTHLSLRLTTIKIIRARIKSKQHNDQILLKHMNMSCSHDD